MTRAASALAQDIRVTEPELIARVLAGDRVAGRELYDAHAPRVFRLVYRLTGDSELAQECTQETFIRAFSHLGRFRGDSGLSTWLHRIAVSVTSNCMRRTKRFWRRETGLDEAHPLAAAADRAEPDLRARLAGAINELPQIYRVVVIMHDIEGYTHAEIAEALGVAEGTCKGRLSIARTKLREVLADFARE